MCRRLAYLVAASLVLMAGAAQAGVWTDDFETPHDFLADGVEGTGWDGFVGQGQNETASALNVSGDRPGQLYLASSNGVWAPSWNPLGPFLYKVVEGDFVATVHVTDYAGTAAAGVLYNNCGLMARVANADDAGAGEDWISIDYFPLYSVGNIVRYADNNARTEDTGGNGTGWNGNTYLQLERVGNTFYLRTSADGVTWVDYPDASFTALVRDDLDGLPVQVGMHHATFSSAAGYAAFDDFQIEGDNITPPGKAYAGVPANRATDVVRDKVLAWTPAEMAVSHDVYFGTVLEDVSTASRTNPLGVLIAQGQETTVYDPAGVLTYGQIYYWRIDEVEADGTIRTGDVWQFTVEPAFYPVENVTATASSFDPESGPEKTVGGIGLNASDQHSDVNADMWLVPAGEEGPFWIQYEFDKVYKLYDMWVWNANVQYEVYLGFSVQDTTVEYSTDGAAWTTLGDYTFARGTGLPSYAHNTTVSFDGALAKYVRINVNSNYGGARTGLSEVRFFYSPGAAREPQPASGATGVDPGVVLSWRAGREAASHEVRLSTDEQAVADGDALVDAVTETSYTPASLELGQTYYWRIDEVNEAETPASWAGDVWDFSTPEYLVVDDFESYTDDIDNGAIFLTWADGFDIPANGSVVGHDNAPYAERTNVRNGRQSMPFYYGVEGVTTSEATRTFATPQDWTQAGAQTLVLYFRGVLGNPPGQLYVKINGTRVDYNGSTASLAAPLWKQWNIDLASLGNAAKSVTSLTIGVSGSGTGLFYVDDVRLYRTATAAPEPAVDPGSANLAASYAMENNVSDGSGNGRNGTAQTGSSFGNGPTGYGKALVLDGTSGYADLPIGTLIQSLNSATFAAWVNYSGTGGAWQRVFDFGTGTDVYAFLTPNGSGSMRFAITTTSGGGESQLTASDAVPTGWHHVAVAIDGATSTMQMYLDGALVASGDTGVLPADLGNTTQNWLGRSQYAGDAYFNGSIDDFRIYNRALSGAEVRYLVGDR